jgi:hypothetical protein
VFVPYVLAEVTVGVIFSQILQYGGPANSVLDSPGDRHDRLARQHECRHLDAADRPDLEVHRVRAHPVPGLGWRTSRTNSPRRPRSTARVGGRSSAISPCPCSGPRSGPGCSCR